MVVHDGILWTFFNGVKNQYAVEMRCFLELTSDGLSIYTKARSRCVSVYIYDVSTV
jgi:hypothetical protein